ncbi:phospho-acceptor domain-containing protein [Krasilnikovia cinnamomea]|uniref:Sensor-like histidine kinase SenX3 n=2 Tax=Krasilnikovia cinnamomea TaxID=349313 RepID=A0A4V2G7Z1_9ACTN|nr:phospho-acceptor domain-containing protein [Krasilnikovia cinnamomea]
MRRQRIYVTSDHISENGNDMGLVFGSWRQWARRGRQTIHPDRESTVPAADPGSPADDDAQAELELARQRNADLERTVRELTRSVAELEAFSREISHDLKSPLAGICGYAQLLAHVDFGVPRPVEFDEFVTQISNGTERMRSLIDDMLTYATARGGHLQVATVDLTALVAEVAAAQTSEVRHRSGVVPRITVDPLPAVRGDEIMLRRVFDNLVSNAVKYVRPGEAARVHISARASAEGWLRVEVTDAGIGIPDGQHESIFGEMHRAHAEKGYPGTGLGLTICRRIVERHGGAIGADPTFTDGTRIWLTLPTPAALDAFEPGTEHLAVQ